MTPCCPRLSPGKRTLSGLCRPTRPELLLAGSIPLLLLERSLYCCWLDANPRRCCRGRWLRVLPRAPRRKGNGTRASAHGRVAAAQAALLAGAAREGRRPAARTFAAVRPLLSSPRLRPLYLAHVAAAAAASPPDASAAPLAAAIAGATTARRCAAPPASDAAKAFAASAKAFRRAARRGGSAISAPAPVGPAPAGVEAVLPPLLEAFARCTMAATPPAPLAQPLAQRLAPVLLLASSADVSTALARHPLPIAPQAAPLCTRLRLTAAPAPLLSS